MSGISIEDLVGTRVLDARGEWSKAPSDSDYWDHDASVMLLRIDGVVYAFQEDPNDGYRSALGEARIADDLDISHADLASFPPRVVEIRLRTVSGDEYWNRSMHTIVGIDEATGLQLFEVGTDNFDDYYPTFVCSWTPEGVAVPWLKATDPAP